MYSNIPYIVKLVKDDDYDPSMFYTKIMKETPNFTNIFIIPSSITFIREALIESKEPINIIKTQDPIKPLQSIKTEPSSSEVEFKKMILNDTEILVIGDRGYRSEGEVMNKFMGDFKLFINRTSKEGPVIQLIKNHTSVSVEYSYGEIHFQHILPEKSLGHVIDDFGIIGSLGYILNKEHELKNIVENVHRSFIDLYTVLRDDGIIYTSNFCMIHGPLMHGNIRKYTNTNNDFDLTKSLEIWSSFKAFLTSRFKIQARKRYDLPLEKDSAPYPDQSISIANNYKLEQLDGEDFVDFNLVKYLDYVWMINLLHFNRISVYLQKKSIQEIDKIFHLKSFSDLNIDEKIYSDNINLQINYMLKLSNLYDVVFRLGKV
jgi:hypothetical protein